MTKLPKLPRNTRAHPDELPFRLAGYPRKDDNSIKVDKVKKDIS